MAERVKRLEEAILEVVKLAPRADAGSDPGFAGIARRGAYLGSHDCRRVGQHLLPLRERTEADGLLRRVSQRRLQRQAHSNEAASPRPATRTSDASWSNRPGAIGTGQRSEPELRKRQEGVPAEITEDCMEGTEPPAQALHEADGRRQGPEEDHDGGRTRTAGLHLGHRDQG